MKSIDFDKVETLEQLTNLLSLLDIKIDENKIEVSEELKPFIN